MFHSKPSEEVKLTLTKIFNQYEQNIQKKKKNDFSSYINNISKDEKKINLNIDINIKGDYYFGINKPVNKMKFKLLKLKFNQIKINKNVKYNINNNNKNK